MALAEYASGYVMYAGAALSEVSEIDFEEDSNDKAVLTLLKGLAGHTNGAEQVALTLKSAVPKAGYEVNFNRLCRRHRTIQIRVRLAGTEVTVEGRVLKVKTSIGVNASTGLDITIEGKVVADAAV